MCAGRGVGRLGATVLCAAAALMWASLWAVAGSLGTLSSELQHHPYRDIAEHVETIDRYTTLAAQTMHERGARAGWLQLFGHAPLAFLRNYILRRGFRDGHVGLIVSAMNAYYVFLKFAKLWELQRAETRPGQV